MSTNKLAGWVSSRLQGAIFNNYFATLMVALLLGACSDEYSTEKAKPGSIVRGNNSTDQPFAPSSEPCGANQVSARDENLYYPGPKCEHVARNLDSEVSLKRYIQLCQKTTNALQPPVAAASVQITECGPAEGRAGITYSKQICCDAVASAPVQQPIPTPPVRTSYKATLDCPDSQLQVLVTNLHSPRKSCKQQLADDQGINLGGAHAQKACQREVPEGYGRQRVLDTALFTCEEDNSSGSITDLAVCCSSTLPRGKLMHPLNEPVDLWDALRRNDKFALSLLFSRSPDRVKERGESEVTPLHYAGGVALVKLMINRGADVDARDDFGLTPLHYAIQRKQHEAATYLLKRRATVDAPSNNGETPLVFAKTPEAVTLLLAHGANLQGIGDITPLQSAAFYGRTKIVELLITRGADINRGDGQGETPLHKAATGYTRTSIDVVRLLISKGANVNALTASSRPATPLDRAKGEEIKALIRRHGGVLAEQLSTH